MTEKKSPLADISRLDALLHEGLKRIAAAQTDLPDAQDPITEALHLSEEQAMASLAAVERGQAAVAAIRNANEQFIDEPLAVITESFSQILASQQAQDLTGQRLKKALTLLRAVEQQLAETISEMQVAYGDDMPKAQAASETRREDAKTFNQAEVDDLLAELGL
ncbi:protein phosphatase CheZ [Acidihalobacter ferrooxydans]|uniref:Uncharacterized protein n=1 Tax=Acidihalobacter ferrooxydans TaxID=1765967 RepID=A0A1P8UGN8_9GAMM|nr:protein phosphatase CheZ [Acidihalobacter ferrooxydans]APZ43013.1 hypothetical protein BW247_07840 [Acidihalobacter ferrooxydans]